MYGILQLLLFEAQIPQIRHVVVGVSQSIAQSRKNPKCSKWPQSSSIAPQRSFMKSLTHICTCRPRLSLHFRPSFPLCHISFYSLLSLSNFFADNVSRTWNHYFHKDTVFENTKKTSSFEFSCRKFICTFAQKLLFWGFSNTVR